MNKSEFIKIVENEGLKGYNIENNPIKANEVGFFYEKDKFCVYYSDEKADVIIIKKYNYESDALEHIIKCLRINNKIKNRRINKSQINK